ncbi:MAG: hypothetical protein ACREBV_04680, partial [Candidatus Zixiibacteriota bacterium]
MNKSTAVIGSILIFFGLIFLLRSLDLIWIDFGDILRVLFPLALISAGIWLIGRHKKGGIIKASIHLSETPSATGPEKPQTANIDPAHLAQQQAEHSVAPNAPPRPT